MNIYRVSSVVTDDQLKSEAEDRCKNRGHKIIGWVVKKDSLRTLMNGMCEKCGLLVLIERVNGQDMIGGWAPAKQCEKEYEMATPEELKRELGI